MNEWFALGLGFGMILGAMSATLAMWIREWLEERKKRETKV